MNIFSSKTDQDSSQELKNDVQLTSAAEHIDKFQQESSAVPVNLRQRASQNPKSASTDSFPETKKSLDTEESTHTSNFKKVNNDSKSIGAQVIPPTDTSNKKDNETQQSRSNLKRSVVNLGTLELIQMVTCLFTALTAKLLFLFGFGYLCCEVRNQYKD